ncbi:uncharacterized protein ACLA_071540 [Aspergillus clavatus NRRL 1]|uniref:Rhodopsin domain-containing protein n=1 Tax=Aspergillus clavatus (strain ATCC 1007 / CBS 513.65 / DSM 816 / NCTC 3887 / NRRL 1 / QM 1276 / 107) TaxID=344612 RepID=A1C6V0_ASPCL|nr:uncharacterized protein ACLA_071540 [Aspergillus clavatus NRRL 1]EAW14121.1 conserved hypothetical protein [Aspergillus clavatus NRRL 1]
MADFDKGFEDESQAPKIRGVMWTMTIVPFISVCLRTYVRLFMKRAFGWDDACAIVAVGCLIGYTAVCHAATDVGLGQHLEVVLQHPTKLVLVTLLCNIAQTLGIMACTLGKSAFALTLLRIVVQRWLIAVLWFIIVTMNLANVLAAMFVFLQCKDPRASWNHAIPSECWPTHVFTDFSLFVGSYAATQDFVLVLLPWIIVWKLQMKKKEKIAVALAMSMGIFAGTAAIIKSRYLVTLSAKADLTWELTPLLIWAGVEDGLAITAASISTLKPLLSRFFPPAPEKESYEVLPYPAKPVKVKKHSLWSTTLAETQTDVAAEAERSSQEQILEQGDKEAINMTTEVSVIRGQDQA